LTPKRAHCTLSADIRGCWRFDLQISRRTPMKLEWHKPEVTEQEVGLEVTSYAPAELDRS